MPLLTAIFIPERGIIMSKKHKNKDQEATTEIKDKSASK